MDSPPQSIAKAGRGLLLAITILATGLCGLAALLGAHVWANSRTSTLEACAEMKGFERFTFTLIRMDEDDPACAQAIRDELGALALVVAPGTADGFGARIVFFAIWVVGPIGLFGPFVLVGGASLSGWVAAKLSPAGGGDPAGT